MNAIRIVSLIFSFSLFGLHGAAADDSVARKDRMKALIAKMELQKKEVDKGSRLLEDFKERGFLVLRNLTTEQKSSMVSALRKAWHDDIASAKQNLTSVKDFKTFMQSRYNKVELQILKEHGITLRLSILEYSKTGRSWFFWPQGCVTVHGLGLDSLEGLSTIGEPEVLAEIDHIQCSLNPDLRSIPTHCFAGFTNLTFLLLHENGITSIEPGAFAELERLKKLDLSNNKITAVNENFFDGLEAIEKINLSNNPLKEFAVTALADLSQLSCLELQDVPEISEDQKKQMQEIMREFAESEKWPVKDFTIQY